MPGEPALRNDADGNGLEEAEAEVREACTLLERGDAAGIEQAAGRLRNAIEIFTGWPRQPAGTPSPRRLELHRSVQRAGSLMEAIRRWCGHRRGILFPEETTPPCYGANGRPVAAPRAGSMTLQA
jgi:hypothetical protein